MAGKTEASFDTELDDNPYINTEVDKIITEPGESKIKGSGINGLKDSYAYMHLLTSKPVYPIMRRPWIEMEYDSEEKTAEVPLAEIEILVNGEIDKSSKRNLAKTYDNIADKTNPHRYGQIKKDRPERFYIGNNTSLASPQSDSDGKKSDSNFDSFMGILLIICVLVFAMVCVTMMMPCSAAERAEKKLINLEKQIKSVRIE